MDQEGRYWNTGWGDYIKYGFLRNRPIDVSLGHSLQIMESASNYRSLRTESLRAT